MITLLNLAWKNILVQNSSKFPGIPAGNLAMTIFREFSGEFSRILEFEFIVALVR